MDRGTSTRRCWRENNQILTLFFSFQVGNSGMFRPEMLRPMGLPEDVNVIAWGLSLERPTMIKYGINNIRDLIGPKIDLKIVQSNPICRLDKS